MIATSGGGRTDGGIPESVRHDRIAARDRCRPASWAYNWIAYTHGAGEDLQFVIHAGHGEFTRLVFAPSGPKDAFDAMIRSFHLSHAYQATKFRPFC